MLKGERQLHAARAGADRHDAEWRRRIGEQARLELLDPFEQLVDRFDRNGMLAGARDIREQRRGPGVDREQIEVDWRALGEEDLFRLEIQADHAIPAEVAAGKTTQPVEIEVNLIARVMPGDHGGQHAAVRGVPLGGDEDEAHLGQPLHAEGFQHRHMRVAATNEHQLAGLPQGFFGHGQSILSGTTWTQCQSFAAEVEAFHARAR